MLYFESVRDPGPTRVFQTKVFARLARAEKIETDELIQCIGEIEAGLMDASLGHGLVKQRIARRGQGKSGGLRTILGLRSGDRAIFIDLFAKKDKANFTQDELRAYRKLADVLLSWNEAQISQALETGTLIEIARSGVRHGKETRRQPSRRGS